MVEDTATNGNGVEPPKLITLEQHESVLRAATSMLVERALWARSMGVTHGGKRDTWGVFGYDDIITAQQYRDKYDRGGIAKRIVDAYPMAVWRGDGELVENDELENETQFEQEWWELNDQLRVWSTLKRVHVLAELSNFSAILIGAPGALTTELPQGKPGGVLYLRPLSGGVVNGSTNNLQRASVSTIADDSLVVKEWDEDVRSRRFGLPKTYQLKMPGFTAAELQKPVHWSRVVHVPAPGFLDNEVFGPPFLQAVWNDLIDLDKVKGGGAEAFWMRANAGLHINIDKKMTLSANKDERDAELSKLQAQADDYMNQMARILRTRGADVTQLGSDVADFSNPQDAILTLIAGTTGIPKRILTGSEMGKLASEQDADNWNSQVKDMRTDYAYPVVLRPFVERLIEYGYLTKPKEWQPRWPDEGAMNEAEKIDGASKLARLNKEHGEIVVTQNEIREYMGREPFSDAEIQQQKDDAAEAAAEAFELQQQSMNKRDEDEQVDRLEAAIASGLPINITVKS